jgi:hypothetical protein
VSQSATTTHQLASLPLPLQVSFDGPQLTSDGGLIWLAEVDDALGLCEALAAALPDRRRGAIRHSLLQLLRQRAFQIACGYEDQNDAATLRHDPLLQLVCGRAPEEGPLASQPTLSRFENAVTPRDCYQVALALVELYLEERARAGIPTRILLDADSTADPVHGSQEGAAFHAYYDTHMYHPLLLFDGDTDQLICAVLRPGTAHASRGIVALLKQLVRRIRSRWPEVAIELRADSGFAIPDLYTWCEEEGIGYTIGLPPNARLADLAAPLVGEAQERHAESQEKVRICGEERYAAGSWPHERRIVFKAEVLAKGTNTRFVVTTRTEDPLTLYDWYVQRGDHPELCIKDFKDACFADRLSDNTFWANQFRLLLHAAAYWLLDTIRRWLVELRTPPMQLDTLRLKLIKIGGWVRRRLDGIRLHLASSHPAEPLWLLLASRSNRQ